DRPLPQVLGGGVGFRVRPHEADHVHLEPVVALPQVGVHLADHGDVGVEGTSREGGDRGGALDVVADRVVALLRVQADRADAADRADQGADARYGRGGEEAAGGAVVVDGDVVRAIGALDGHQGP